jgi:hypothetical protein
MYLPETQTTQQVLPLGFNCPFCPLKSLGLCEGTFDLKSYSMEHPSLIGCLNIERLEKHFADVFDIPEPIPKSYNQHKIELPSTVFGLTDGRLDLTQFEDFPQFAVSMNVFIKENGDLSFRDMNHLKTSLKLPLNSKVALIGTSSELKQQAIWKASKKLNIWKRIAEFDFAWVTSTSFSVWDINPRSDQIINQRRNYFVSDILANFGVPTIPFVYPFDDCDYKNFRSWINLRPDINKLAVLAQYYNTDEQFEQLVKNMHRIQESAGRSIQFLIVGAAKKTKIIRALSSFGNCSFVSTNPYAQAVAGNRYDNDFNRIKRLDLTKPEVWFSNYKTFFNVIESLRNKDFNQN